MEAQRGHLWVQRGHIGAQRGNFGAQRGNFRAQQDAQRLHKDSGTLALPKGCSSYIRSEQGSGPEGDDVLWYTGEKFRLYDCPNHQVQVLVLI